MIVVRFNSFFLFDICDVSEQRLPSWAAFDTAYILLFCYAITSIDGRRRTRTEMSIPNTGPGRISDSLGRGNLTYPYSSSFSFSPFFGFWILMRVHVNVLTCWTIFCMSLGLLPRPLSASSNREQKALIWLWDRASGFVPMAEHCDFTVTFAMRPPVNGLRQFSMSCASLFAITRSPFSHFKIALRSQIWYGRYSVCGPGLQEHLDACYHVIECP